MSNRQNNGRAKSPPPGLAKAPTGIAGLDEVTGGGLPRGRPTLVCGSAGCGKTLLAMEFLVRGATDFGEPGVFMAFEESTRELSQNVRSLGFDLDELVEQKKVALDFVQIERGEIEEIGEYDLEGLFVRLNHAIDSVGAKRVVLDTIEALFSALSNAAILRAELRRLFRWLKDKGVTAIITAERGDGALTRQGLEEYVSDCVILLDHRVIDQVSTRRLRVVKYRGTTHGTNEYPFLIDENGISVLPITALGLQHAASDERVPTGIPRLDAMLGGKGYYRGSTVLVSGTPGSGKSSVAAHFANATCERGERCLFVSYEESERQLVRNMKSIGLNLDPWVKKDLLRFHATRATMFGLEMHLAKLQKMIDEFQPSVVIIDPITTLSQAGGLQDATATVIRMIDLLKSRQITALLTTMTTRGELEETSGAGVSSLADSWLLLRDIELNGERNRGMYVLKSRGMAHSNQIREFLMTGRGITLEDVYIGADGVLTGSARQAQEAREKAAALLRRQEIERRQRDLEQKRAALEGQVAALWREFAAEEEETRRIVEQEVGREDTILAEREQMAARRRAEQRQASNRQVENGEESVEQPNRSRKTTGGRR